GVEVLRQCFGRTDVPENEGLRLRLGECRGNEEYGCQEESIHTTCPSTVVRRARSGRRYRASLWLSPGCLDRHGGPRSPCGRRSRSPAVVVAILRGSERTRVPGSQCRAGYQY